MYKKFMSIKDIRKLRLQRKMEKAGYSTDQTPLDLRTTQVPAHDQPDHRIPLDDWKAAERAKRKTSGFKKGLDILKGKVGSEAISNEKAKQQRKTMIESIRANMSDEDRRLAEEDVGEQH